MIPAHRICLYLLVLLCGLSCSDTKIGEYNTPPSVTITSPVGGESYSPEDMVELIGVARDDHDGSEELEISWSSSLDGELGTDAPDANGDVYLAVTTLSSGTHAITLMAIDSSGESATSSVDIEIGYGDENEGAPTVDLVGPESGEEFLSGDDVAFVGTASDDEQASDTLDATLVSSRDGSFWTGNPGSDGTISTSWSELSVGEHTVTLTVVDEDGNSAQDLTTFEVLSDGRPSAEITSPATSSSHWTDAEVVLEGMVSDEETDIELLTVSWESDVDGVLSSGVPDSSGYTAAPSWLTEGWHVVTLTVVDEDEKEASDSITIEVVDPLNFDDDGDGYTENEGDCDDDDDTTYPDAEELCDLVDNDCDGEVNEDWMDAYESNDSDSSYYDLGTLDGWLWDADSITMSGLTFHWEDDADYFYFDAEEDWYENISFEVTAGDFPLSGDYVAELWMEDGGSWQVQDSASGSGTFTLEKEGSWLTDDEDLFMVVLYAQNWPSESCDETYDVTIEYFAEEEPW